MTRALEKNLIFFHPAKPGELFRIEAGNIVNFKVVEKIMSRLEKDTEKSVACVLERREYHRTGKRQTLEM